MSVKFLPHLLHQKPLYIIGINSGTSADGFDMVYAKFVPSKKPEILKTRSYNYPEELRKRIIALAEPEFVNGVEWMALDYELGDIFGKSAKQFAIRIRKAGGTIDLVGSHGQTIRHIPTEFNKPLTLQVGDPSLIARKSGLPVVADFRRSDIAAGGEGAPLSPILHETLFRVPNKWRAIVNIGGIANITILPPLGSSHKPLAGDCGPGNMLIDLAMRRLFNQSYDFNGMTAQQGIPNTAFVDSLLDNPYFRIKPPKSTGRELFGQSFLENVMKELRGNPPEDIIATLSTITIASIADFIKRYGPRVEEIYLCGGGAKNRFIMNRLKDIFKGNVVESTVALGYNPDYLEALLWALLAYRFITENPIETRNFTGAIKPYIPGKLCLP
jgi:anhydro-N-acetylmuramic acid kinase